MLKAYDHILESLFEQVEVSYELFTHLKIGSQKWP